MIEMEIKKGKTTFHQEKTKVIDIVSIVQHKFVHVINSPTHNIYERTSDNFKNLSWQLNIE